MWMVVIFLVLKNRNSSETNFVSIFAARKRSLGQGNIFRSVCYSVHRERWSASMRSASMEIYIGGGSARGVGGFCIQEGLPPGDGLHRGGVVYSGGLPTGGLGRAPPIRKAGGTHPTEMLSCLCL